MALAFTEGKQAAPRVGSGFDALQQGAILRSGEALHRDVIHRALDARVLEQAGIPDAHHVDGQLTTLLGPRGLAWAAGEE